MLLFFEYLKNQDVLAEGLKEEIYSPVNTPSWDFEDRYNIPKGADDNLICEPTVYRASDGKLVMLARDKNYSHRLYVSVSENDGKTWPEALPTDIPDSPSLSKAVELDNGKVVLIGNQIAPEFDNSEEVTHYQRAPLTISISPDGYTFNSVYSLRKDIHEVRLQDIKGRGKTGGGQYPDVVVHNDALYVIYSMEKEDISISRVSLSDLNSEN